MRPEFSGSFNEFRQMPSQFGFVGLKVLSPILAPLKKGDYYVRELVQSLKDADLNRTVGGNYSRKSTSFKQRSYACRELGLEARLPDDLVNAFPTLDSAEAWTVDDLWRTVMRGIEYKLVTKLTDSSVFTGARTGTVAVSWKTHASSTPQKDILKAQKAIFLATGLRANTAVMAFTKYMDLIQSEEIRGLIKYWGGQDPNPANYMESVPMVARALNIDRLLIGGEIKNTANPGLTASLSQIWPVGSIGVYVVDETPSGISEPCVGRTPTWPGDGAGIGGDPSNPTLAIESYREEQTRSEVYRTRAELDVESALDLPDAGYVLTGADA
jgi:hypothetical protein